MDTNPNTPTVSSPMTQVAPATTRPQGVTILAVLSLIGGAFGILFGLMWTALFGAFGAMFAAMLGPLALLGAGIGIGLVVLSIGWLATGIGYLRGMSWSWYLGIGLMAVSALLSLSSVFTGDIFSAIFGLAIDGFVIWYLLSPPVQRWFKVVKTVPWQYPTAFA